MVKLNDIDVLNQRLLQYPLKERDQWRSEALRLSHVISKYADLKPKRLLSSKTDKYEFIPEVIDLCKEAICSDPIILIQEPHRAAPPSPFTLDAWLRGWKKDGPGYFLRKIHSQSSPQEDKRFACMTPEAVEFINENWRSFRSPRALYKALLAEAQTKNWILPSESRLYRRWQEMPKIVRTMVLEGKSAYESKCAPYLPRNYEDLAALQVLCGDHSERDVTVLFEGKSLIRPWLTVWQDLRTGLIWGWYIGRTPSSESARLAYADGILKYGAQPFARPDEDFYSYIYTDHGKDYRSHDWDGKTLLVHEQAMSPDGQLECFLVERRIGVLDEFGIKRIMAARYNAKEKPVERLHKDFSTWEANYFDEYCSSHPQTRSDRWREMYRRHQQLSPSKILQSPFITFESYREKLAGFIDAYNTKSHDRITLGGKRIIPLEELRRLYTTKYEISPEAVALALLKGDSRVVGKNGINCFQKDWYYSHEELAGRKGQCLEIRFNERDYRRIWFVLPDKRLLEAQLITPTSLLNPNKETLEAIKQSRRREKKLINDYKLIKQSEMRGESIEDRALRQVLPIDSADSDNFDSSHSSSVHQLSRFNRPQLKIANSGMTFEIDELPEKTPDFDIAPRRSNIVREFDEDQNE